MPVLVRHNGKVYKIPDDVLADLKEIDEDSRLGQGAENVKTLLKDNPELADEIETQIREKLGLKPVTA